jgi:steroid delta-isomerase-like uncharacterized protein
MGVNAQDNIACSRSILEEAFGRGNLDLIDQVSTEDYVDHDPIVGDQDRESVKQTISGYREAFPDLQFTIEDAFAADDRVVVRWRAEGTFEKAFMGQEPTHEKGEPVYGIGIDRYQDGKLAESWTQWDTLTFMRNIGALPELAAAGATS